MVATVSGSYTTSLYPAEQTQEISAAAKSPDTQTGATVGSKGDTVSLSQGGRLVASFFQGLGVDYAPGQPVSLEDLEAAREENESALRAEIHALFDRHGISESPPVDLTTDEEGRIRVQGDHPQKEEIEQLFADRPDLANGFRKVSALTSLVEAGEEYIEFSRAYAQDPQGAVARFGHLFDAMDDEPFSLLFNDGEAST